MNIWFSDTTVHNVQTGFAIITLSQGKVLTTYSQKSLSFPQAINTAPSLTFFFLFGLSSEISILTFLSVPIVAK
jgi:hypothetical protein